VSSNKPKAYIDFDHLELNWAPTESKLYVNAYVANKVPEPARNVNARFAVGFMPAVKGSPTRQTQDKAFADFEKLHNSTAFRGVLGPGQQIFGTITVTDFDQHFLDHLNSGEAVLIVIGRILFADDNGNHRKDSCQFVQPPLSFTAPTNHFVTHFCDSHNDLRY
jgi:hypothetical protein